MLSALARSSWICFVVAAASFVMEMLDGRDRTPPANFLLDTELRGRMDGNLRQVRNAEHLETLGQRLQPGADHVRDAPPDSRVDLVEDQRLARRIAGRQRLERQHHT